MCVQQGVTVRAIKLALFLLYQAIADSSVQQSEMRQNQQFTPMKH